ncbi:DEAD/DEAH box helicase [Paenibacillus mendelii]|uniref:DEAD/DEAH box helicase n=1 Tax=Paenibacillus mendelii TaxID=206163 RepID=A0ABV6J6Z8_9BACL|nr:DEAD/DEAH box helicase [Paenibacillus mendelii]MCQ6561870.1 DEAD/DEAH box helicase [Paenibacillus mendelii]
MSQHSPALSVFHPILAGWFAQTFGEPTDVQLQAWASILSDQHTLIAAPTGSGKTLAALLPCLDKLAKAKASSRSGWKPGVRILYVTPLKALNNDIQHHLTGFMEAIERYAATETASDGPVWMGIRTAVRTGDTPASERAKMLRRPPDVLVTTPESLYLMLTSEKGRAMLQTVWTVIVDEIHGIAGDKRGAHLSLTLERLSAWCSQPIQRIGVSATQKPLERVARFLGGWDPSSTQMGSTSHPLGYHPRPVTIVESTMVKTMQVRVTMPDFSQPAKSREGVWVPIVERLLQLMTGARSVLLFVNSRRLCERLVLRLNEQTGFEFARAHHGSLARERRLEVEGMLKNGELRCLVATSSLELGIDVGHVDLVLQVDPPMDAASGIQRIGRAGHAVGDVSRGFIVLRSRGQLPEAAVLCRNIARRDIEEIRLPDQPIDVLSQQITAIVAAENITVRALLELIAGSECYRNYTRAQLDAILKVLAGFYPFARPLIDWNRDRDMLSKRANTSVAAITGVGTIPQSSAYPVHHADSRVHLGELDEDYIHESRAGDVFQLGTTSWMISRIEQDRVYVKEAPNRFSEIPFWNNEPGGRRVELGIQLGHFLGQLTERLALDQRFLPGSAEASAAETEAERERKDAVIRWLDTDYGLDSASASELIELIYAQHKALGLPTDKRILIEHYRDLTNQQRIIIHNPFGRRLNRTWLLAIERQFEKLLPYRMYGNAKDNGIELVLPEWDASWLRTLWHITPASVEPLLAEAISGSPMLGISFRRIAETSLLLSRSFTRTPMWQKRLRSEELLKHALPYAEHFPYLQEAMRESLHVYMDTNGLKQLLENIAEGHIEIVVKETNSPSPFAIQFLADYVNTQIYEGDGFNDATRLQLLSVSKSLAGELFGAEAVQNSVDPGIIRSEEERLDSPALIPATAEELFALLKKRGDLTTKELSKLAGGTEISYWLEQLEGQARITSYSFDNSADGVRWICTEELEMYEDFPDTESAIAFVAGRYAEHRLSFTDDDLRQRYALSAEQARLVIDSLLALDRIEQAPFAATEHERIWTSRSVAKRLIRLTLEEARKQADPVDPVRWCSQMALLQHVLPGTQLSGIDGLRTVIGRLQGFFLPASHWESIIFPARVTAYRKDELDLLCASGEIVWIGKKEDGEKEGKIAFFLAESKPLYAPYVNQRAGLVPATKHPELLALLRDGGASFLTRLSRDTGKIPSELLADLIDLVWEGHVSNDQFAPLRLQLQTKGKRLAKTGSGQGRWYWTGSLTETTDMSLPPSSASDGEEAVQPVISAAGTDFSESALHWTQHLLDSCGIVSKELVAQTSPFSWDELLPVLRQLEHWGVVTRGLLVQGVPALQFARRELIASVHQPLMGLDHEDDLTVLSAVDPANPFGLTADWPVVQGAGFARKGGNYLVMSHGRWRYWLENNGRKVVEIPAGGTPSQDASLQSGTDTPTGTETDPGALAEPAILKQMFRIIMRRQALSKIKIDRWNGEDITESAAAAPLRALGAERDNRSLVLWPSQLQ